MNSDLDFQIRLATFHWLKEQTTIHGDVLPRKLLSDGFLFQGTRIPLVAPQGIFKPRILELPLTITTTPKGPYDDSFSEDGFLQYRYRGTDPYHRDNVGLQDVMQRGLPLAYLHGIIPGKYLAVWPVYVVGDDPSNLVFSMAVDDAAILGVSNSQSLAIAERADSRRAYLTRNVRVRLHQRNFRERVLEAYRSQCAFCRLRHRELLDAAHIIPDSLPESTTTVDNGMALCKLHHAAYDSFILGVTPDFEILVRGDVLEESDGPILQHGLKELHHTKLTLPNECRNWPNRESLEWKYSRFLNAA